MIRKKLFVKIIAFIFCIPLLVSFTPTSTATTIKLPFPNISSAPNVYLYHFESGNTLISKGTEDKIAPASTVKIMTGLVALELLSDKLDKPVLITKEMLKNVEGYTLGLKADMSITTLDLLYGLICSGGNDAATILSIISAGSVDAFVARMNEKATSLGMTDTVYKNPTGIDAEGMVTSLADTVTLSMEAIKNSTYMKLCGTVSHTFQLLNSEETKTFRNRNPLISSFAAIGYQNKKVKGLNAGMTDLGGYCVSAYATNGENSYLCIIMGGTETSNGTISSYTLANSLLNYAFEKYTYTLIASKEMYIGNTEVKLALPTNGANAVTVDCVLSEDIYAYAPAGINYKYDLTYKPYFYSEILTAPVQKNTVVGGVDIYYENNYIASGTLITSENIKESKLLLTMDKMKSFMTSRITVISLIIFSLSVCLYLYLTVWRKKLKYNKSISKNNQRK